jgi:hypothetical protein
VRSSKPKLSPETINLIKEMAANNRLWGAERIRGELLKLNIGVSKRTIQKYMRQIHPTRARSQSWKTFLRNHAAEVCPFSIFLAHISDFYVQMPQVASTGIGAFPAHFWFS